MFNRSSTIFTFPYGEAHVWLAWTDRFTERHVLDACRNLLSEVEFEQQRRFHFARDRRLYLVSHAMARYVLAGYLGTKPRTLEIVTNIHGRPEIVRKSGTPDIRFNISHTRGLAALVVNHASACGIDVETEGRLEDFATLAASVLSSDELETFRGLPEPNRSRAFLRYWTLKEAYVKARGQGLFLPLDRFSFDINAEITIRFHAEFDDDPADWQFIQSFPGPEHVLAVAIHHGNGTASKPSMIYRELAPSVLASIGA